MIKDILESVFDASTSVPFIAGAVFGASITVYIGKQIAGYFGLNEYKSIAKERKERISELENIMVKFKEEIQAKDKRIEKLHQENRNLKNKI